MERQTRKYNPGSLPRQAEGFRIPGGGAAGIYAGSRTSSIRGCVGNSFRVQASNPPWITPTRSYPRLMRIRARLALVASPGQGQ